MTVIPLGFGGNYGQLSSDMVGPSPCLKIKNVEAVNFGRIRVQSNPFP